MSELNSKIPDGPLPEKWSSYKEHAKLVNPANKRKLEVIVIGTGLAGAAAAATLAELGYKVKAFCFHAAHTPSLRRVASMPRRIIRTTVIRFFVYSTILLKVAISAPAKETFTGWQM